MDKPFSLFDSAGRHSQLILQGIKTLSHGFMSSGDAVSLANALGHMRGPVVKVAQFLATLPGVLPPEYASALANLQNQAPPMNPLFVRRRMANELGPNWQQHFATFDISPSFAASLGQVHKAILNGGFPVACKLQYPRMSHLVEADLNQLHLWLRLYKAVDGTIDHSEILKEIRSHLEQELDYKLERQNMNHFSSYYSHLMVVPKVIPDLSTSKLLTMEWHEGKSVWDTHISPETVATMLFHAWYTPFYERGWLHSDPHPGNYVINQQGQLVVFDFGCTRQFSPTFVEGVRTLYQALKNNTSPIDAFYMWGFKNLTEETSQALTMWARLLFDPLLDNNVRTLYDNPETVRKQAENVYHALQKAGGITPPREFVLMDRTALGLGSVITRMKAKLNWHKLFESIIATTWHHQGKAGH